MAFTGVSSLRFKKHNALKSNRLVKKSLILAHSILYLGEPVSPKLGSIILGFTLNLALDFILGLSIKKIYKIYFIKGNKRVNKRVLKEEAILILRFASFSSHKNKSQFKY